jgi:hypothetical protein
MAPPTLYDQPPPRGLMSAGPTSELPISLRAALWSVALVLGAVLLCLEIAS